MTPPQYADIGKRAKDVFGKGYHFGLVKLDVKTKTESGVEFTTSGTSNQESGKVSGSLETKYQAKDYGLTFTEKWNTDNTLTSTLEVKDQLLKGLKVALQGNFSPQTGSKSGSLKVALQNQYNAFNATADLNSNGPIIKASNVIGRQGWLIGTHVVIDTQQSKISSQNVALGFTTNDFIFHSTVNNSQEFAGGIYQKISNKLETAIDLAWTVGGNNTRFGLGAKYTLDMDASLRAKVNNQSQIGLGYQQRLRDGVVLTLSTLIDGKNLNSGGHKIGLALELEA